VNACLALARRDSFRRRPPRYCELAVPHLPLTRALCEFAKIVVTSTTHLHILLVVPAERRREIARQLLPLHAHLVFANSSGHTEVAIDDDDIFQVALLPASLSDTAWWNLWGVLAVLNKRPAILVYAREATFQLWSSVLESGGYDLIVEPFSDVEIRSAVLQAAQNFEERLSSGL
jgi:hypothetical protein